MRSAVLRAGVLTGQSVVSDDEATIQKGDEFPCEKSESNSGGGR